MSQQETTPRDPFAHINFRKASRESAEITEAQSRLRAAELAHGIACERLNAAREAMRRVEDQYGRR